LDERKPRAQLVAIEAGKIIWVGDNEDRKELAGQKIDCEGKTLVPGFNDAHCHILAFASSLVSVDCSPSSVSSIADIQARIRDQAQRLPRGSWLRGSGYNEFYLAEKRHPNCWDLDRAAPHHPVKLTHRTGHASVLNSLALSYIGISMDSAEPPGGMIERDLDSGEPNGLLLEMEAHIAKAMPPLAEAELERGIRLANEKYISLGITSLQDATVHSGLREWHSFRRLKEKEELAPRLWVMMGIGALGELERSGFYPRCGSDGLRLGAVKIVLDETTGSLYPGEEELTEQVLRAHQAGFQVAIHAIEEGPVAAAANALEHALRRAPGRGHRHRVEHCSVCPPPLLQRLKDAGAIVVTQPAFVYYSGERYLATVPEGQLQWLYRIGSFLKEGLMPAAGSDSPIAPNNPLAGIYAAVTRKAESSAELVIGEKVSPLEALALYTRSAAYASFDEEVKGSIAEGKLADFALLSADPTGVQPDEIQSIEVEMTIVDGRVVWPH
ncbi:MAG: amidohydrolase, partial [Chloroflexota bacterium]